MAKRKGPGRITVQITEAERQRAIDSNSGGCLIADAIKAQGFSNPLVDMATIRFTDRKAGQRYTYLTPADAQHLLLSFDQGWSQPTERFRLQGPVKITPITTAKVKQKARAERLATLEAKVEAGKALTAREKASLTMLRRPPVDRPVARGPAKLEGKVVVGGNAPRVGPPHPNLLRGRDRLFGAKLADPGKAFSEAVAEAVAARDRLFT